MLMNPADSKYDGTDLSRCIINIRLYNSSLLVFPPNKLLVYLVESIAYSE